LGYLLSVYFFSVFYFPMDLLNQGLRTTCVDVQFEHGRVERFEVYTRYNITCALGQGGYGSVVEAEDQLAEPDEQGSKSVAIKKLPQIFNQAHYTKCALREILVLQQFSHSNILGVKDIMVPLMEKDGKIMIDLDLADVYVVLDKMDYDLARILEMSTRGEMDMDLQQRRFFLYQILRGLKCIHSANVLHRDLKPSNILVNTACEIKICDFGMARGGGGGLMTAAVTTQWYRAPELLLAGDDDAEYDRAVDIWSTGCIMAEMMLLRPLFPGKPSPCKQLEAIFEVIGGPPPNLQLPENPTSGQAWPTWPARPWREILSSSEFDDSEIDLVGKMLRFEGKDRVTVGEALEHPHLAEWHDPDDEPTCEKGEFVFAFDESDAECELLKQFAKFHPEVGVYIKSLAVEDGSPTKAGK